MANNKPRGRMPVSERAKQFMPFAAVKGLDEALERKRRELVRVQKIELSEEMSSALNEKMKHLEKGMLITATYYIDGEYILQKGELERLDLITHQLCISGQSISFNDLLDISLISSPEKGD